MTDFRRNNKFVKKSNKLFLLHSLVQRAAQCPFLAHYVGIWSRVSAIFDDKRSDGHDDDGL